MPPGRNVHLMAPASEHLRLIKSDPKWPAVGAVMAHKCDKMKDFHRRALSDPPNDRNDPGGTSEATRDRAAMTEPLPIVIPRRMVA